MEKTEIIQRHSLIDKIIDYLFKPIDINDEITTPEIETKYNNLDKFNKTNPIYKQLINEFIIVLKKNFKEEYLKNFYNNINELKVKDMNIKGLHGIYKINKNEISIRNNMKVSNIRGVVYHELFHMASSTYKKGRRYSGFSQRTKIKKKVIGNGINEGYTELLAHRYCNEKFDIAYKEEYNIVLHLEEIIGEEEMSKLYFNADLRGLIDKLREYANDQDILEFITSVDSLRQYYNEMITKREFQLYLDNAYKFLLKAYIKKQEKEYKEKTIDKEEFVDRIGEYVHSLKIVPDNSSEDKFTSLETKYILETSLKECIYKENIHQKIYSLCTERH